MKFIVFLKLTLLESTYRSKKRLYLKHKGVLEKTQKTKKPKVGLWHIDKSLRELYSMRHALDSKYWRNKIIDNVDLIIMKQIHVNSSGASSNKNSTNQV